MKFSKLATSATLLGIALSWFPGEAVAQTTLGDLLNGAINALKKKNSPNGQNSQDPQGAKSPGDRVAVKPVSFDDVSALAKDQVPALSVDQFNSLRKLWREHLSYETVQTLFGTPSAQLPPEFNDRFAKTNFKDGFARQDFVTWAQPYVNWSENYLMKTQIFVCPACDAVTASIFHYDFKASGFHVVVSLNETHKDVEALVKFPDDVTRKIESLVAADDAMALAYLSIDRLPPNAIKPLAVQVFQRSNGQSLGVAPMPAANASQFAFIQAHAVSDPVSVTQVAVAQADSSLVDALQADPVARRAAAAAPTQVAAADPGAAAPPDKQYSFAAIKAQVKKLSAKCAKNTLATADSVTSMTDPYPDLPGIYVFLSVQNSGKDPFILGPLSAVPTPAELGSLKGSKVCLDAAS